MFLTVLTLVLGISVFTVEAHVALTFPPARKYDLDFLDTFRTETPCGMNKGAVKTTLLAGQKLDVTWHLGYPHRGGYALELLDNKEQLLLNLTQGFQGADDKTAQKAAITLPSDFTCPGCTIRLLRQALEWGKNYQFQSCADVDIVSPENYQNTCSGQGVASGTSCSCNKNYVGDLCQYMNDCDSEADCGYHGQCVEHGGTSFPLKECYCDIGYFGRNCEKISPLNSKNYNASLFHTVNLLPGDVTFLWRYLDLNEEEMEGILIAKTTSFVAIGWRPDNLEKSCQKFPTDAPPPKGNDFHAMDCQDIVIGKVKGDRSNIGDYFTRDRSTPRRDEVYGGEDDLLGAVGWEEDGKTIMWFRKKVDTGHRSDHEFYGQLKLIWAHGRSDDPFYTEDELKYHGGNRGAYTLRSSASQLSDQRKVLVAGIILIAVVMGLQAVQNFDDIRVQRKRSNAGSCFPCCGQDTNELKVVS